MKILLINNSDGGLFVFRGPLIKRLLNDGYSVITISPYGEFIEKVQGLGAKTYEVDFGSHSSGIFHSLKIIKELYKIIKSESPDVVHSFTHKPNIFGSIASKIAGIDKYLMTLTGLGTLFTYNDIKTKLLRYILICQYKICSSFVKNIIFQNPDDLEEFGSLRIGNKKNYILVNGSGIDVVDYKNPSKQDIIRCKEQLERELNVPLCNKKVILFPARALKEKGFYEFYEAAKVISTLSDEYIFLHLGLVDKKSKYGVNSDDIYSLANKCNVHYLGFKHNIKDYMIASDIVALPSHREGTPRSLIEALALNKMIITTNTPGCKETVINGWNGVYCNVSDTNSLISEVLTINKIYDGFNNNSRLYCEAKYNVDMQYITIRDLYGKNDEM